MPGCGSSPSPTGRSTRTSRSSRAARRRRDRHARRPPAELARDAGRVLPAEARRVRQPRRRAVHDLVRDRRPAPEPDPSRRGLSFARLRGLRDLPALSGRPRRARRTRSSEAKKLVRKLPRRRRALCHCPPRGVNDDPDDPAHIGFEALRDWVLQAPPALAAARPRRTRCRARSLTASATPGSSTSTARGVIDLIVRLRRNRTRGQTAGPLTGDRRCPTCGCGAFEPDRSVPAAASPG